MPKILVVDDEVVSAFALSEYLADEGYEVRTATSGREALKVGSAFSPDILLSDWKLTDDIDGLELARRLGGMNSAMRSIIVSGLSVNDVRQHSPRSEIFKFLEKPCSLEEVNSAVKEALEG